jgi:hypothetical protein
MKRPPNPVDVEPIRWLSAPERLCGAEGPLVVGWTTEAALDAWRDVEALERAEGERTVQCRGRSCATRLAVGAGPLGSECERRARGRAA